MTSTDVLVGELGGLTPVDEREREAIRATLDRLTWPGDPFDEAADPRHVTASAFVISSRGVILHRHRQLGLWIQPGGHVDEGETPPRAALRETVEETGLRARHLSPELLFHVDVHAGPRGHTHFDLRYVLVANALDPTPLEGESPDVYWFDFNAAQRRCEPSLAPALAKLATVVATWDMKDLTRE